MANLRNSFDVTVTNGQLPQLQEEATANGMGTLRRAWNAGQLGTEANYLAAQELGLRNDGRHAEADGLRAKIAELQQRQQLYAPQVGRVEDIGGVGDAASWAATQMGQGAASMADPMALAAGVGAAGRVAGMVKNPVTQMFSKAAPYLAGVGAYGVNQRQLTGEMGNSMAADPEPPIRPSSHSTTSCSVFPSLPRWRWWASPWPAWLWRAAAVRPAPDWQCHKNIQETT